MAFYRTCPRCGANLDPGEQCDCRGGLLDRAKDLIMKLSDDQLDRLMTELEKEEAVRGATNTTDGKAEKVLTGSDSASNDTKGTEGFQA